jgi:hypothetical protein
MELYPTRDIFPADVFFYGDESRIRVDAKVVVQELARLNKDRLPWSRFVIASYVKSGKTGDNSYANHLASERARLLSDLFVNAGLEPRRMIARAVIIDEPLVIDPQDDPLRYNQAIEFIPIDR